MNHNNHGASGHADLNGIKLYHELYGQGEPLVLLHGGLMTIGEMSTLLEPLARTRRVIAVELQGHGRTADTDRPLKLETLDDDIAALLGQLDIAKADVVGLSLGGAVGLRGGDQRGTGVPQFSYLVDNADNDLLPNLLNRVGIPNAVLVMTSTVRR